MSVLILQTKTKKLKAQVSQTNRNVQLQSHRLNMESAKMQIAVIIILI